METLAASAIRSSAPELSQRTGRAAQNIVEDDASAGVDFAQVGNDSTELAKESTAIQLGRVSMKADAMLEHHQHTLLSDGLMVPLNNAVLATRYWFPVPKFDDSSALDTDVVRLLRSSLEHANECLERLDQDFRDAAASDR